MTMTLVYINCPYQLSLVSDTSNTGPKLRGICIFSAIQCHHWRWLQQNFIMTFGMKRLEWQDYQV